MRAAIALGSNLDDRLANLQRARDQIRALDGMTEPTVQSAVFETLQKIEQALGRERNYERNVSRTIDLDLLYFGSERRSDTLLQLPHPRMTERKFVLQPLCDIAPDLRLPGQTKNVGELLAQLQDQGKITRLTENR